MRLAPVWRLAPALKPLPVAWLVRIRQPALALRVAQNLRRMPHPAAKSFPEGAPVSTAEHSRHEEPSKPLLRLLAGFRIAA